MFSNTLWGRGIKEGIKYTIRAQKKDWWELFTYMTKPKLKQRHTEAVNTYPERVLC